MAERPAGVLLVNLGSPDAPTPQAVRRFLREFLSDRRVVDRSPLLWQPLLRGVILPRRAPRSAELYRRVWTPDGSPLLVHGRRLAAALQAALGGSAVVVLAMRYGEPSLRAGLERLEAERVGRLLVLPLFPQHAEATVGSVRAAVASLRRRAGPELPPPEFAAPRCDDALYIAAVAARVRESLRAGPVDHHAFSFHGLPQRQVDRGDPYRGQCEATARALAAELGLPPERWTLVYQSRFGPEPWLQPYADVAVPALAPRAPRVLVTCPGFAADCLETLDEIGTLLAERFRAAGGTELRLTPCLNDHPAWVAALLALVREHLSGSVA